jgi:DNA (cytosine-5)-methyltransferase 1
MGGTAVIGDLAEIGYDAEWRIVSAAGLGAPHKRERIIIVAYPNDPRGGTSKRAINGNRAQEIKRQHNIAQFGLGRCSTDVANTDGRRQQERYEEKRRLPVFSQVNTGKYDSQWEIEPDVGRVANGVPFRVDRLKGLGNAVVPQVAEYVGCLIVNAQ